MPLGFIHSTLPALYMLAGMSACPQQGPVDVQINLVTQASPYVTDVSSQSLTQEMRNDPDSSAFTDGKWMTGGVTKSNVTGKANAQFRQMKNTRTGETCFAVARMNYDLVYAPVIYIASDFTQMGCRYSATLMHEKRHVSTDMRTFNEYLPQMKQAMQAYAQNLRPQGPYPAAQVEDEERRVIQEIAAAAEPLVAQLVEVRRKRQGEIDTEQNYLRDTALCPGQFPKFDGTR